MLSLSPGFKRILLAEDHLYLVLVLAITALPTTRILRQNDCLVEDLGETVTAGKMTHARSRTERPYEPLL
jgi:hypothetical protein